MTSLSGIFVGDRAPPATPHAISIAGIPTKNGAAVPNRSDAISTAKPANVIITGCRIFGRCSSEATARAVDETCRTPKKRLQVRSDALTTKLTTAAAPQHTSGTPNAAAKTIPQSFWPGERPWFQFIATTSAERNTTDVALNTRPTIAAFFGVHSLTEIWYGRMVGENRRFHSRPLHAFTSWNEIG